VTSAARMNGLAFENQHMQITTITPAMAAHWLANLAPNRNISQHRVATYVGAIQRGEWRLTFEAIKLDERGRLADGQHRLTAVVQAKMPIEALVVYGVSDEAMDVLDGGRPRSVANNMTIHGEDNTTALAATLRFLTLWDKDHSQGVLMGFSDTVTVPQAQATLAKYPEARHWVGVAKTLSRSGIKGGVGMWGGLLTLFCRLDQQDAEVFSDRMNDGMNLGPGSPMLVLRKQLFNNPISTHHQTRTAVWIIKAWNAFRGGDKIHQLKWGADERFPEPE